MGKAEIALQLTLKAMDGGKAGLVNDNEEYMENAKRVYEFYNKVYDNLHGKFSKPAAV